MLSACVADVNHYCNSPSMSRREIYVGKPPETPIGWRHYLATLVVTSLFLWAAMSLGGCGNVQEQVIAGRPDAGDGGSPSPTSGQAGKQGVTAPDAGGGAAGTAGAPATGGGAGGAGGTPVSVGGQAGTGVGGPSCGSGPVLPGGLCSRDADCLSGTCSGGWCATCADKDCASEKAAAPMPCEANGWLPPSTTDCGGSAPVCYSGYRCLNCGPIPGGIGSCVYDRAGTSLCVPDCSQCASP